MTRTIATLETLSETDCNTIEGGELSCRDADRLVGGLVGGVVGQIFLPPGGGALGGFLGVIAGDLVANMHCN